MSFYLNKYRSSLILLLAVCYTALLVTASLHTHTISFKGISYECEIKEKEESPACTILHMVQSQMLIVVALLVQLLTAFHIFISFIKEKDELQKYYQFAFLRAPPALIPVYNITK
jgi:hypothetical protein